MLLLIIIYLYSTFLKMNKTPEREDADYSVSQVISERGGAGDRQRRRKRPNGGGVAVTDERQETQLYDTQRSLLK